jgi:hypothetical protein
MLLPQIQIYKVHEAGSGLQNEECPAARAGLQRNRLFGERDVLHVARLPSQQSSFGQSKTKEFHAVENDECGKIPQRRSEEVVFFARCDLGR